MKDTEILRLISIIITAIITILTAVGIAIDPALAANATAIVTAGFTLVASIIALLEWGRANVFSRESATALANAVLTADKTGSVPYKAVKAAKDVEGASATFVSPALVAGLVALGFPPNFAAMVGPKAAKIALEAGQSLLKTPLDSEQLKASRDAELKRRAQ